MSADLPPHDAPADLPAHDAPADLPAHDASRASSRSSTFSLEGREAPGLYLVSWLLVGGGAAILFIAIMASDLGWRGVLGLLAAALLGTGFAASAGYQIVARADRPTAAYRGPSPLLVFGIVVFASLVVSALLFGSGVIDGQAPVGFLVGLLIVAAGYALAVWLFVVRSGALDWRAMGWPGPRPGLVRSILRDAGVAIAVMVPTTFAVLILASAVGSILGVRPPDPLPEVRSSADALAVALAAAAVAPIGEELFFRGFALTAWLRDLGPRSALIRSSVFFAVVHVVNINSSTFAEGAGQAFLQLVVILPLGFVLGLLFLRRGIVASIAGHMSYNGLLLIVTALAVRAPSG